MNRTTIMLPEGLKMKAMQIASKRHISLGEFIRESIQKNCENTLQTLRDPFFADTTTFNEEAPKDLSIKHDDYLYGDD